MERSKPLANGVQVELSVSEVLNYLKKPVQPSYPALKPKAGEIYLISWNDDSCKGEFRLCYRLYRVPGL